MFSNAKFQAHRSFWNSKKTWQPFPDHGFNLKYHRQTIELDTTLLVSEIGNLKLFIENESERITRVVSPICDMSDINYP